MIKFKKVITFLVFLLLPFVLFAKVTLASENLNFYLFYSTNCPHCAKEEEFLQELENKYEWLKVNHYEISNPDNAVLFGRVAKELNAQANAVPFSVFCEDYFVGFADTSANKDNLERLIVASHEKGCNDKIGSIMGTTKQEIDISENINKENDTSIPIGTEEEQLEKSEESQQKTNEDVKGTITRSVRVPLLGEIEIADLSLPVFTFIIAFLDGFNPCAMWVLLFLISLLLGMEDRFKMWVLGSAFILASGLMYFMFLAAWLHLFLFIGFIKWVRIGIGIFALGAGIYYLYDYQTNKSGTCKVTGGEKRKKVFEQIKSITQNKNFLLSLIGIILLAFAVNLVELICSAGLPAVYTEVLSMTPMPKWQYYLYLIFYIFIFMLDDLIVYIVAMKSLHAVGISGKYSRVSHLIGGIVMLIIGVLMIFRPELLMFG